jgi:hypothetical protein
MKGSVDMGLESMLVVVVVVLCSCAAFGKRGGARGQRVGSGIYT